MSFYDDPVQAVHDELERLEQAITFTLQEIDQNFSQCHTVVATKILPKIAAYSESSVNVIECLQLWHNFFAEAATSRPPWHARSHATTTEGNDSPAEDRDSQRQELFSSPDIHISPSARALMRRRQQARFYQRQRSNDLKTPTGHPTGHPGGLESIVLSENTLSPTFLQECSPIGSLHLHPTPVPAMQRTASKRIITPLGERASMLRLRHIQEQRTVSTPYASTSVEKENVGPNNRPIAPFSLPKVVTPKQLVYLPKFRGKHPDPPQFHKRTERRALVPKLSHADNYVNIAKSSTGFTLEGDQEFGGDFAADQVMKETQDAGRSNTRTSDESLRIIDLDPTQKYPSATTQKRPRYESGEDNDEEPSQSDSVLETRRDSSDGHRYPMDTTAVVCGSATQSHEQNHTPTGPPCRPRTFDPRFNNPIVARLVTPEEYCVPGFRSRRSMLNLTTVLDESDTLTLAFPTISKTARSLSEPTPGASGRR
ncbi:DASH complex subunit ask1 [Podila epicladia]|nr:DASH complex subunit ask1 [Podila epicladia]